MQQNAAATHTSPHLLDKYRSAMLFGGFFLCANLQQVFNYSQTMTLTLLFLGATMKAGWMNRWVLLTLRQWQWRKRFLVQCQGRVTTFLFNKTFSKTFFLLKCTCLSNTHHNKVESRKNIKKNTRTHTYTHHVPKNLFLGEVAVGMLFQQNRKAAKPYPIVNMNECGMFYV